MKIKFKDYLNLFKEFIHLCDENNIWYIMTGNSLLNIVKDRNFVFLNKKIEIAMTIKSYDKLKRISNNVVDSFDDNRIDSFSSFYVKNKKELFLHQSFIEISVIVPTTIKKIKRYKSKFYNFKNFIKKKPRNIKTCINDLNDKNFEGFLVLKNKKQNIYKTWIQTMSFKTEIIQLHNINISIPIEYKNILSNWFGFNFMNHKYSLLLLKENLVIPKKGKNKW